MQGKRILMNKIRITKSDSTVHTLYCLKTAIMIKPKTKTAGSTIQLTDNLIMSDGVEIKPAKLTIEVGNVANNYNAAEALSADSMYPSMIGEGEYEDGSGLVLISAQRVVRVSDFEIGLGTGSGVSSAVEFDCGEVSFIQ